MGYEAVPDRGGYYGEFAGEGAAGCSNREVEEGSDRGKNKSVGFLDEVRVRAPEHAPGAHGRRKAKGIPGAGLIFSWLLERLCEGGKAG